MTHETRPLDRMKQGQEELNGVRSEFRSIAQDVRDLAGLEMQLARAEMKEQASYLTRSAIWGGLALLAAFMTAEFTCVTLMLVFWVWMPMWSAALITTLVVAAIGTLAFAMVREHLKKINFIPERTVRSVREDVRCLKDQLSSSFR